MIVKCQLSIETNEPVSQLLFYNKSRDWFLQCDVTPEWQTLFDQRRVKRFFAEVKWPDRLRVPVFVRRLTEQNW